MRILLIGSDNPWRMESAVERAFQRAGHKTLLIDDRRARRVVGRRLTQRWALRHARRFRPDFVFLSKCLALDPETVDAIIGSGRVPNAMWYHDPQWYRDLDRPDVSHVATIGRLAGTFFVTGFDSEWRAHGLPAKFLPAAGDSRIHGEPLDRKYLSDVAFIGTGYDPDRANLLLAVAGKHDVRVWGLGWEEWRESLRWSGHPVEGRDFSRVCSSASITLGINPTRAAGGTTYTSDRTWMVILAGAFISATEPRASRPCSPRASTVRGTTTRSRASRSVPDTWLSRTSGCESESRANASSERTIPTISESGIFSGIAPSSIRWRRVEPPLRHSGLRPRPRQDGPAACRTLPAICRRRRDDGGVNSRDSQPEEVRRAGAVRHPPPEISVS